MNKLVYKIIAIAFTNVFFAIVFIPLFAQTKASTLNPSDQIKFQLLEFNTNAMELEANKTLEPNKWFFKMNDVMEKLKGTRSNLLNVSPGMNRKDKAALWFDILAVIDKNTDPDYNPTNVDFSISIEGPTPPPDGIGGIKYAPGVDPSVLKDTTARSNYVAALIVWRDRIDKLNFQASLMRINSVVSRDVEIFLRSYYTSSEADKQELNEILEQSTLSESRKQQLRKIVSP
jgi:hypothetical protein